MPQDRPAWYRDHQAWYDNQPPRPGPHDQTTRYHDQAPPPDDRPAWYRDHQAWYDNQPPRPDSHDQTTWYDNQPPRPGPHDQTTWYHDQPPGPHPGQPVREPGWYADAGLEPDAPRRRRARPLLMAGALTLLVAAGGVAAVVATDGPSTSTGDETASTVPAPGDPEDATTGSDGGTGGDGSGGSETTGTAPPGTDRPDQGPDAGSGDGGSGDAGPQPDTSAPGQAPAGGSGDEPSGGGEPSSDPDGSGDSGSEVADTTDVAFEGYQTGSPQAVTAAFFDAVGRGDCDEVVDLWAGTAGAMFGDSRQDQIRACEQTFQNDRTPDVDASSVELVSREGSTAVVSLHATVQGSSTRQEMYLVRQSGWKVDLTAGAAGAGGPA